MEGLQEVVLETLRQMQQFLDDNGATLDVVNRSGARKTLDDIVVQMGSHAVAQVGGRRSCRRSSDSNRATCSPSAKCCSAASDSAKPDA